MTETKEFSKLEKSPFYNLFKKHPWVPFVLMLIRRLMGGIHEFIEVHAKPFTTDKNWWR